MIEQRSGNSVWKWRVTSKKYYYYYDKHKARKGPVVASRLIMLRQSGDIDGSTYVWTATMKEWKKMSEIPALSSAGEHRIHPRKSRKSTKWVYATGIPAGATEEEVADFFKKCGIIQLDIVSGKPRVKLYKDNHGKLKGDCAVAYEKRPSVDLAVQLLDGADFREGIPISVVEAVFDKTTRASSAGSKRSRGHGGGSVFQTLRKVESCKRSRNYLGTRWVLATKLASQS